MVYAVSSLRHLAVNKSFHDSLEPYRYVVIGDIQEFLWVYQHVPGEIPDLLYILQ